jgi:hypothetical protein
VTIELTRPTRRLIIVQPWEAKKALMPAPKEAVSEITMDGAEASQFIKMQMLRLIPEGETTAPVQMAAAPTQMAAAPTQMAAAGGVHPADEEESSQPAPAAKKEEIPTPAPLPKKRFAPPPA